MGFFSWDCKACNHPALSSMAVDTINAWMNKVVVLHSNGSRLIGEYDGYGRVDGAEILEIMESDEVELWHYACWVKSGKPEYSGPSHYSDDQGWFFDEGDHDMEEPILENHGK